jgi:hypothetical protein
MNKSCRLRCHKRTMKIILGMSEAPPSGGRPTVLARLEPQYEHDLEVDGHNELLPLPRGREHAMEFGNLLTTRGQTTSIA